MSAAESCLPGRTGRCGCGVAGRPGPGAAVCGQGLLRFGGDVRGALRLVGAATRLAIDRRGVRVTGIGLAVHRNTGVVTGNSLAVHSDAVAVTGNSLTIDRRDV